MSKYLNYFLDFLLPRFCYNCGSKIDPNNKLFCKECFPNIQRTTKEIISLEFDRKFRADNIISEFQSPFIFTGESALQKIIHDIKYNNAFSLGKLLGEISASELMDKITAWKADFLVPVPIHKLRKAERGYNQSYFIARGISKHLKIPVQSGLIKRARYTSTQTALNLAERKENIKDAFTLCNSVKAAGKRIILVDDVITTGATITECGKVLIEGGAEVVFALSAAIAE